MASPAGGSRPRRPRLDELADPETLTDRVVRWAQAEMRAREDEQLIATAKWYRLGERRQLRSDAAQSRDDADDLWADLPAGCLASVASDHIAMVWHSMATETHPNRNVFSEALRPTWTARAADIAATAQQHQLAAHRRIWARDRNPRTVPGLVDHLNAADVIRTLSAITDRLAAIAADRRFLVDRWTTRGGEQITAVQHQASGLRALFKVYPDDPGFGSVNSKPYTIDSIDPAKPGRCADWALYAGLGIGTEIYRRAARELPGVRWPGGITSSYSDAVRRKLHADQPFTWRYSHCDWCSARIDSWRDAPREAFTGHG